MKLKTNLLILGNNFIEKQKIKEYCIKKLIHSEWEVIIKLTE